MTTRQGVENEWDQRVNVAREGLERAALKYDDTKGFKHDSHIQLRAAAFVYQIAVNKREEAIKASYEETDDN